MWKSLAIGLAIACAALASAGAYLLNQVNAEQDATASEAAARHQAEERLKELQSRFNARNINNADARTPSPTSESRDEWSRRDARREERYANGGGRYGRFEGGPRGMRMGGPGGPTGMFGLNKDMIKALKLGDADVAKLQKIFEDRIAKMRQMLEQQGRGGPPDQQAMDALQKESDQQIHDALGDQKFQDYQDYRKDMQEHNRVSQLDARLSDNGQPAMTQEQQEQLFAVLKEEKGTVPAPKASNYGNRIDFNTAMTDWRNAYDQRVQDRVVGILTPEQFSAFQDPRRGGGTSGGNGGTPPRRQ